MYPFVCRGSVVAYTLISMIFGYKLCKISPLFRSKGVDSGGLSVRGNYFAFAGVQRSSIFVVWSKEDLCAEFYPFSVLPPSP